MAAIIGIVAVILFVLVLAAVQSPHPLTPFVNKLLAGGTINGSKLALMLGRSVRGGRLGRKWGREATELQRRLEKSALYKRASPGEKRHWKETARSVEATLAAQNLTLSDTMFTMEVERVRLIEHVRARLRWIEKHKLQKQVVEYPLLRAYVEQALPVGQGTRRAGDVFTVSSSGDATSARIVDDKAARQALDSIQKALVQWEKAQAARKARMH